ncbi:hypothetical protein C8R43DRAFT_1024865 [Mycena crocata]|nr:hypothetical protein C8R43DRAFT_1024815 [Mycena crocata]KAJ7130762.1 hypothetical protein C8R43DRAFT_1024865 [Mycena crocata]
MSAQEPKKPPACNPCRARRVLCHPQSNGTPCPRCAEKKIICTTTPVPRGRPRKNPLPDTTTMSAQGPKKPPACDICKVC